MRSPYKRGIAVLIHRFSSLAGRAGGAGGGEAPITSTEVLGQKPKSFGERQVEVESRRPEDEATWANSASPILIYALI